MITNISKFLTIPFLLIYSLTNGKELWRESFSTPGKGIWGSGNGNISSDFEGITTWSLEYSSLKVTDADDYAKTVSTSGGRFEVRDVEGEVTFLTEVIDISDFETVDLQLQISETGSGTNTAAKYIRVYYKLDGGDKKILESGGENKGNWGKLTASQMSLKGKNLQVIAEISNQYAADKVIIDEITVTARLPYLNPEAGDLVINEILFNPIPGGEDYVEILNRSSKLVSAKMLYLASRDKSSDLVQICRLSETDQPVYGGSYLALTKDTNAVFPWFNIKYPSNFLQMKSFPSFNNDYDRVVLLNGNMEIIDELYYSEEMHSPLLAGTEGISLERISPDVATNEPGNWYSASTDAGYGTPGYENSQSGERMNFQPVVYFDPEAISPNLDGYNDEYQVHYELNKPGYIANAAIFDSSGNLVLRLANNIILGASGCMKWDGKDETGKILPVGVYVVAVEIFNTAGEIYRYKDGVVLTNPAE